MWKHWDVFDYQSPIASAKVVTWRGSSSHTPRDCRRECLLSIALICCGDETQVAYILPDFTNITWIRIVRILSVSLVVCEKFKTQTRMFMVSTDTSCDLRFLCLSFDHELWVHRSVFVKYNQIKPHALVLYGRHATSSINEAGTLESFHNDYGLASVLRKSLRPWKDQHLCHFSELCWTNEAASLSRVKYRVEQDMAHVVCGSFSLLDHVTWYRIVVDS